MSRTVVALYDNFQSANDAVRHLVDQGFRRDDISFMAGDKAGEYSRALGRTDAEAAAGAEAATGAGVGAGIGAAVGGLAGVLIGLGALVIPGVGPVLAAGPLATVLAGLAGAGAGAVAGGVLGALVDMGIPEETAGYYAEGVRRGGTLVTVQVEDHLTESAVDILNQHNPVDLSQRVGTWRESGWTGYQEGDMTDVDMSTRDVGMTMQEDYSRYDTGFREHFAASPFSRTYTYDDYAPAYQFGHTLANDPRYRDRQWNEIEPEIQRQWQTEHPDSAWDQFKDSIRYAWQDITGQRGQTSDYERYDNVQGYKTSGDMGTTGFNQPDYQRYDNSFRQHFTGSRYAGNYRYEDYEPAYRYGYTLASDPRYRGREWNEIEQDAMRDWQSRGHESTWDQVKDSVRHAWQQVKETVR